MNVRLTYLYRDAGNFKNWGEVVFANPRNFSIAQVDQMIRDALDGDIYLVADHVDLSDLHFEDFKYDLDHGWHELHEVELTDATPTDERSINEFIEVLRTAPVV
jgi:hypothetical protein